MGGVFDREVLKATGAGKVVRSSGAPADAPAEYLGLLRLISLVDVVVPIAVCLAFGWILWRLRSPAVRDQFH